MSYFLEVSFSVGFTWVDVTFARNAQQLNLRNIFQCEHLYPSINLENETCRLTDISSRIMR